MSASAKSANILMQLTGLKIGKGAAFNGCMIGVNEFTPPLILPFSFSPTEIEDDFHPQYEHVSAPAGAWSFPIFLGMGPRTVKFKLLFDAKYPTVEPGMSADSFSDSSSASCTSSTSVDGSTTFNTKRKGKLGKGMKMFYIDSVIARLEKMKMPRNSLSRRLLASKGSALLVSPDAAEPSPPLILLATGINRFYLGYLDCTIKQVQFNQFMMCTRIEVDCTFYTSPDMICTNLEELYRVTMATMGLAMTAQK